MQGKLIICPTPIGNLGDMTQRALDALQAADTVCAEDTRVTGKLLAALGIQGKRIERLDENLIGLRSAQIVDRVLAGEVIAYCSDAGMPGVSDPGLRLVRAARQAQASVEVLPGPSAAVTAFVATGCTSDTYYFGGFFPRKQNARSDLLKSLKTLDAALVFYESPNRLRDALECITDALPFREVSVCRELTKLHEEVVSGQAPEVCREFSQREAIKGEIVIVIGPPAAEESRQAAEQAADAAAAKAAELAQEGLRAKQIARQLTESFGLARNEAYELALASVKGGQA